MKGDEGREERRESEREGMETEGDRPKTVEGKKGREREREHDTLIHKDKDLSTSRIRERENMIL